MGVDGGERQGGGGQRAMGPGRGGREKELDLTI